MNPRIPMLAIGAVALAGFAGGAAAQQEIKLTIASSHPVQIPWVGAMPKAFIPEVNAQLAKTGKYKVVWNESYGGQLYKANATLTSVSQGITDIGWVFNSLEPARLPLAQIATVTPGVTEDNTALTEIFDELNKTEPALKAEWDKNNVVYLGASVGDSLQLMTKTPVRTIGDLKGRKISAAGAVGNWLRGTAAIPVDGALPSFYTDAQTGVTEGVVSALTVARSIKLYEVLPYYTRVGFGAIYHGALVMNKGSFQALPQEVRNAILAAGTAYSKTVAEDVAAAAIATQKFLETDAAALNPPVRVATLPEVERRAMFTAMPNIAQEWVKASKAKGLPADALLAAYGRAIDKRGIKPVRDWTKN